MVARDGSRGGIGDLSPLNFLEVKIIKNVKNIIYGVF